jgi:hypothetical protein
LLGNALRSNGRSLRLDGFLRVDALPSQRRNRPRRDQHPRRNQNPPPNFEEKTQTLPLDAHSLAR